MRLIFRSRFSTHVRISAQFVVQIQNVSVIDFIIQTADIAAIVVSDKYTPQIAIFHAI